MSSVRIGVSEFIALVEEQGCILDSSLESRVNLGKPSTSRFDVDVCPAIRKS
jgi:hypothetical protein